MKRKANGHNAAYIKRLAKSIKKSENISHHEALDRASKESGFANWANFLNLSKKGQPQNQKVKATLSLPNPLTLPYHSFPAKYGDKRPNAKMPISAHQKIADYLKMVKGAVEYNKKAFNLILSVQSTLDDWIQQEYRDKTELPDEAFFKMYFGQISSYHLLSPSNQEKQALVRKLRACQQLLKKHYHECPPIISLHKKIDSSIKLIENWPASATKRAIATEKKYGRIEPNTLVTLKSNRGKGLVIKDKFSGSYIKCYTDSGIKSFSRDQISVARDQSRKLEFNPMKLMLPYGKWICKNGSEVLFNRDYKPIWIKDESGVVYSVEPHLWIRDIQEHVFFFQGGSEPWSGDKKSTSICLQVLKEWSVDNKVSKLMALLAKVALDGDIDILKSNDWPS